MTHYTLLLYAYYNEKPHCKDDVKKAIPIQVYIMSGTVVTILCVTKKVPNGINNIKYK